MIMEDIAQGIRCLMMHRLRTFLSALGVLFGVVSVISMLAIGEGSKQEVMESIQQLGTNNVIIRQTNLSEDQQKKASENQSEGLTCLDALLLKQNIPSIEKQACLKVLKANIGGVSPDVAPEVLAVNAAFSQVKGLELAEGRFLADYDLAARSQVCVLGAEIAKKLGRWGHVGQMIRIDYLQFLVVGILNNKQLVQSKNKTLNSRDLNHSVFVPLGTEKALAQQDGSKKDQGLSEIILQLKSHAGMAVGVDSIRRVMEVRHKGVEDYQIIIPHELINQANQTQNIFNLVLGGIAALSMLVGGIGIMNVMLANISARTREIGIRRAVGANRFDIAKQFLVEALILTLTGAFFGLIGGIVLSHLIGVFAGWNVIVTGWSVVLALGMAVGVGCISGLYPAIKAASMDPIKALRHP